MLLVVASPLAALDVKLAGDSRTFRIEPLKLEGDRVTFRRSGAEQTAALDDFEPASAFAIKRHFTPAEPEAWLELARFALHRELFTETRAGLDRALELDRNIASDTEPLRRLTDIAEADALLREANASIDKGDFTAAREKLSAILERLADAPAAGEARVLLPLLPDSRVAEEAAKLEEVASEAQKAADEAAKKKREPGDRMLDQYEEALEADGTILTQADAAAASGKVDAGLREMEKIDQRLTKLRENLTRALAELDEAQCERAAAVDAAAAALQVRCLGRWAAYLLPLRQFAMAKGLCERGLELEPGNRVLLALMVDIAEVTREDE